MFRINQDEMRDRMQSYSYQTLSHNFRSKIQKILTFHPDLLGGKLSINKLATIKANIGGGIDINQEVSFFVAQKSPNFGAPFLPPAHSCDFVKIPKNTVLKIH